MLHRIREAWQHETDDNFSGPVEVDETFFGGRRRNMPAAKRATLKGRGTVNKTAVAGIKDRPTNQVRAKMVKHTDAPTLQRFIVDNVDWTAKVYPDDATAYASLPFNHESVCYTVGEYVREQAHTYGIEINSTAAPVGLPISSGAMPSRF